MHMPVQVKQFMVDWVKQHVASTPTLDEMAHAVGYSTYYCSRHFKELTGMTYKVYVSKCKLEAIASELIMTNETITVIAQRYGYASSDVLSRAFYKQYQKSPSAYRKQYMDIKGA